MQDANGWTALRARNLLKEANLKRLLHIDNIAKEIEHILTDSKYSVEMKEKAKVNVAQFTEKFYYRQLIHILEG